MTPRTLARTLLCTAVLAGCDAPPPETPASERPPSSTTVASLSLGAEQTVEISETGTGAFIYRQQGRYGSKPVPIPADLLDKGDPVAIWQHLAPTEPVPAALLSARQRAVDAVKKGIVTGAATAVTDQAAAGGDSASSDEVSVTRHELSSSDVFTDGKVPGGGCPFEFFNGSSQEGRPFCPLGSNNKWCMPWRIWAFSYKDRANGAYAAVCTDQGSTLMNVYVGDSPAPVAKITTSAGAWSYVRIAELKVCTWFSCSTILRFKKFDIPYNASVFHFGGAWE